MMNEVSFANAYLPGELVLSIVPRSGGERVMQVIKACGGRGGTIVSGRNTVNNKLARLFGLDSRAVEMVFTLVDAEILEQIFSSLGQDEELRAISEGVALHMNARGILRRVPVPEGENTGAGTDIFVSNTQAEGKVMSQARHELISIIVNTGFADEIMEAARKAGATGGTILNAKGTGRAEDVKFFGITIVPEKEFIVIVVPKNKAKGILKAIQEVPCLNQPGVGIAFCVDVVRFQLLGKKAAQEEAARRGRAEAQEDTGAEEDE